LNDLILQGFIEELEESILSTPVVTYYKLNDCPLRMLFLIEKLASNPLHQGSHQVLSTQFQDLQGWAFEEICRRALSECGLWGKKIFPYHWNESCTEIDILAIDNESKIVHWGSCKRSASRLSPVNQMCHVVSFFNNRGFSAHHLWFYTHNFVFLSPTISEDQRNTIASQLNEINNLLKDPSKAFEKCRDILSNVRENRNHDKKVSFTPKMPIPESLFQVNSLISIDLNDLAQH